MREGRGWETTRDGLCGRTGCFSFFRFFLLDSAEYVHQDSFLYEEGPIMYSFAPAEKNRSSKRRRGAYGKSGFICSTWFGTGGNSAKVH